MPLTVLVELTVSGFSVHKKKNKNNHEESFQSDGIEFDVLHNFLQSN